MPRGPWIAIAGPEATGKSSLAQALSDELNLRLIEDARPAYIQSARCDTLFEAARYRPVWRELLDAQLQREATEHSGIVDTCVIDYWVLWQRWGWCSATVRDSEQLYQKTVDAAARYTHIVAMPPHQLAAPRGSRFLNLEHARQIWRLGQSFLQENGLGSRCVDLTDALPPEYVERVLASIARPDSSP